MPGIDILWCTLAAIYNMLTITAPIGHYGISFMSGCKYHIDSLVTGAISFSSTIFMACTNHSRPIGVILEVVYCRLLFACVVEYNHLRTEYPQVP